MQESAKQCLGLLPVTYAPLYTTTLKTIKPVAAAIDRQLRPDRYYWSPDFYKNTWFIDALTIDPLEIISNEKVIYERGRPQPVRQRELQNASVGSLPKVLVYIAVHEQHGAHLWFPFHGAKHGGTPATKEEEGKMYQEFDFWYNEASMTPGDRQHIKDYHYYNYPAAKVKKVIELAAAKAKTFDACNFLVRTCSCVTSD